MQEMLLNGKYKSGNGSSTTRCHVLMTSQNKVSCFIIGASHTDSENHVSKIEVTFAEVKRQLSREEHEQVEKGEMMASLDDGSPSSFVVEGLELEETQCVVLQLMSPNFI